jgi:ABC-type taurine transport system ATPase subunit
MAGAITIKGFRDPSLGRDLSLSVAGTELAVLAGPPGAWMHRLASRLAGLGSGDGISMPSGEAQAVGGLVLLRPPFFDPSRDVVHQIENRLVAFGMRRSEARDASSGWCKSEGLSRASRKKAGALSEGELAFFSLAVACIVRPQALVLEDPLSGMSGELADKAARILQELSRSSAVLVLASDPLRLCGIARIDTVQGSGDAG